MLELVIKSVLVGYVAYAVLGAPFIESLQDSGRRVAR